VDEYYKIPKEQRGRGLEVTISTSSFVPKPFTPFQWEAQDTIETLGEKQVFLKNKIRSRHLKYNWHDPELSMLEAVFSRGDRRLGRVLHRAWELGCRFDSWGDHFKFDAWMQAFDNCGIDPAFYANRKRDDDEVFPWDHIDVGVSKKHLLRERKRAEKGEITPNCMTSCVGCGASVFGQGICNGHTGGGKFGKGTGRGRLGKDTSGELTKREEAAGDKTGVAGDKPGIAGDKTNIIEQRLVGANDRSAGSIRIRFTRGESVKFLSHLDLMKVFERGVRRSGLPVSYSKGFNPHPRMILGLPLAVGMTSECEHADFQIDEAIDPQEFMQKLDDSLPDGIRVTAAAVNNSKKNIMALVRRADYELEVFTNEDITFGDASKGLEAMLKRGSIRIGKETRGKHGEIAIKEIEIRPMIIDAVIEEMKTVPAGYEVFKSAFLVKAGLKAGSEANLSPGLFIKALAEQWAVPAAAVRMHRKALYADTGSGLADPMDEASLS
jgi:radical SAM-linked protein